MGKVDDDRKIREANYAANLKAGKVREPSAPRQISLPKPTGPMTKAEARAITAKINEKGVELAHLLLEAHDREAWKALGFDSWRSYATESFTLSQSRAYQLLTHARVVEAISEASFSTKVEIGERETRAIAGDVEKATSEIRARVASGEDPSTVVPDVVKKTREKRKPKASGPTGPAPATFSGSDSHPEERHTPLLVRCACPFCPGHPPEPQEAT